MTVAWNVIPPPRTAAPCRPTAPPRPAKPRSADAPIRAARRTGAFERGGWSDRPRTSSGGLGHLAVRARPLFAGRAVVPIPRCRRPALTEIPLRFARVAQVGDGLSPLRRMPGVRQDVRDL